MNSGGVVGDVHGGRYLLAPTDDGGDGGNGENNMKLRLCLRYYYLYQKMIKTDPIQIVSSSSLVLAPIFDDCKPFLFLGIGNVIIKNLMKWRSR